MRFISACDITGRLLRCLRHSGSVMYFLYTPSPSVWAPCTPSGSARMQPVVISVRQSKRRARVSIAQSPVLSLCVVTTASPPVMAATRRAQSLAPPMWPDRTEMTKRPVLSTQRMAGSVYLSLIKGAMLRMQMPIAPIKTKRSYSRKCAAMNCAYEGKVWQPSRVWVVNTGASPSS